MRQIRPQNRPLADGEKLSGFTDIGKERAVGAGHPGLGAQGPEFGEQRGAPPGVQMGRDFVQKQDGGGAAFFALKTRVGEHDGDQTRLLLAGRAERGGLAVRGMPRGDHRNA